MAAEAVEPPRHEPGSAGRERLGQFFTPLPVVEFILDALAAWRLLPLRGGKVLDPACGHGVFLRRLWERGLARRGALHGLELDPAAVAWWREGGLGGWRHLHLRDGLHNHPDLGIVPEGFDLVIGNPPYGHDVSRTQVSEEVARLEAWERVGKRPPAHRCPVEVLFLERFLRLARPGGTVAVILPEGVLANARYQPFRDWLLRELSPRAIVSLPRATFGPSGATAKTAILFARRRARSALPTASGEATLLVAPATDTGRRDALAPYLAAALEQLAGAPDYSLSTVDLLGKPWNPEFWDGAATAALEELEAGPWPLAPLGRLDAVGREVGFIRYTTYGAVGRRHFTPGGTRYLGPRNLTPTGIDFSRQERYVSPGGPNDPPRSRLRDGDILLCNSGVASVGRPAIFTGYGQETNIAQHINLIRVEGIDPFYVAAYLHTRFARAQLRRFQSGTGAAGINFDQIRALQIPVLPSAAQEAVRRAYATMHALHLAAVTRRGNARTPLHQARALLEEVIDCLERFLVDPGRVTAPRARTKRDGDGRARERDRWRP